MFIHNKYVTCFFKVFFFWDKQVSSYKKFNRKIHNDIYCCMQTLLKASDPSNFQLPMLSKTQILSLSSKVWMVLSDWPSDWRWLIVVKFRFVPIFFMECSPKSRGEVWVMVWYYAGRHTVKMNNFSNEDFGEIIGFLGSLDG